MRSSIEKQIELYRRHRDYDIRIESEVLQQEAGLVWAKATEESKELYNKARQVIREYDRLRSFLRFEISPHGIFYARIKAQHDIEDMVVSHFMQRFPGMLIVISSEKGCFIGSGERPAIICVKSALSELIPLLEESLPRLGWLEKLKDFNESMYEAFYMSQNIEERRNRKLFLRNMPKRFHSLGGLKLESYAIRKTKKLSDFA